MRYLRWTLEVDVAEDWIADGFGFGADRCRELAEHLIPYAAANEVRVRVVKHPKPVDVASIQGR